MRLTLDQLEDEVRSDTEDENGDFEPFEVEVSEGIFVTMPRPEDMPAAVLMIDDKNVGQVLRVILGEEGFAALIANRDVTLKKIGKLMSRYNAHFGLGDGPKGSVSPRSSSGSARPSRRTSAAPRAARAS